MKKIIVLVLLVVFVGGCASCNKVEKQEVQNNNERKVIKKSIQPRLSPGTVLIEATILEKGENSNSLYIKVDRVLASGHSTPVLAVGEKINVKSKNGKYKDLIINNNSLNILLKNSMQKVGDETSTSWSIISVK